MVFASASAAVLLLAHVAWAQLTESSQLAAQARTAYQEHRYADSAALYRRALPGMTAEERSDAEYNLACSEALGGQHEAALHDLQAAVRDGFTDGNHIASDSDLVSLHADPRFGVEVEAAKAAVAQDTRRWGTTAFKSAYSANLSDADKVSGLSLVWAEVKFGFGNGWHVPELEWDRLYRETIPKVLATRTTFAYYRVLQNFMAQLHDGHSNVYAPDAVELNRLPFLTSLVDGRVLITRLLGTAANRQEVRAGDEIVSVNGEPVRVWAGREVEPYQSASSPQDLAVRIYRYALFVAPHGTAFQVGVRTGGGAVRTLTFETAEYAAPEPPFEFRMLPGKIAYVALNEFGDEKDAKEWDAHWEEIAGARGLVLDMRRNGGGSDAIGAHVLATLLDKPVETALVRSTRWVASWRAWDRVQTPLAYPVDMLAPDPKHHFAGPVAMLTGPRTYSAGEDMVVAFRTARRGSVVGLATGGSTGQPLGFDLPGGGSARVCTLHDSFPDGTEFVGLGVAPDVLVPLTAAEATGADDTTLRRALAVLSAATPKVVAESAR